jgi:hypothetical protein
VATWAVLKDHLRMQASAYSSGEFPIVSLLLWQ